MNNRIPHAETASPPAPEEWVRVAMVILEYHPVVGGAQRQLRFLAPLLRERGIDLRVLTRAVPGAPRFEEVEGVPVERLLAPLANVSAPDSTLTGSASKAFASGIFRAAALAKLRAHRPDVVHAFSLFSPCEIAVMAKRLLGIPSVVKVLRGGEAGDVARLLRKPRWRRRAAAMRTQIDRFGTISDEIAGELTELGVDASQCIRIPNGVDTRRFRPVDPGARERLRTTLALPQATRIVAYTGRLVSEKRVDRLIDSFCAARRDPNASDSMLVIVGDGPERAALEARAAAEGAAIRFVGACDDVLPWLQSADAFALTSDTEGLSNAMLEAMACGLPVVVSAVGAAPEVVLHRRHGYVVEREDILGFRDALRTLLASDDEARRSVGAAARQRVEAEFSLERTADLWAMTYRELAAERAEAVASRSTPLVGEFR